MYTNSICTSNNVLQIIIVITQIVTGVVLYHTLSYRNSFLCIILLQINYSTDWCLLNVITYPAICLKSLFTTYKAALGR